MRLAPENCWYASLCFADTDGVLPWNPETAELWLTALFGEDRPRIREAADSHVDSRQYTLPC